MNDLDFTICRQLKYAGLVQRRETGSRYYISPTQVVKVEDLDSIRTIDNQPVNWAEFCYIPRVEDLYSLLGEEWWETRREVASKDPERQVTSYSTLNAEDGQHLRASGKNLIWSLARLAVLVKSYGKRIPEVQ